MSCAAISDECVSAVDAIPRGLTVSPRANYLSGRSHKDKRGVTKGSVVTYLGQSVNDYRKQFESLGAIKGGEPPK